MLQRTILVILAIIILVASGCTGGALLDQQRAKDRDLAQMVETNLLTSSQFIDNIVSFEFADEPGKYICNTKDLTDPHDAGVFAYNVMAVLDERNNTKVRTGRSEFLIVGKQNGTVIFEVRYGSGYASPEITLLGPFEGETYTR